jgi:hypothetical protein
MTNNIKYSWRNELKIIESTKAKENGKKNTISYLVSRVQSSLYESIRTLIPKNSKQHFTTNNRTLVIKTVNTSGFEFAKVKLKKNSFSDIFYNSYDIEDIEFLMTKEELQEKIQGFENMRNNRVKEKAEKFANLLKKYNLTEENFQEILSSYNEFYRTEKYY